MTFPPQGLEILGAPGREGSGGTAKILTKSHVYLENM